MLKFDLNILWMLINLVFFFFLMKLVLFKPIKKVLDKRQKLIDEQFENVANAKSEADSLKAEYESQLSGVDEEKKQILADARADAKVEYEKIVNRANNDADRIKSDAKLSAQAEVDRARRQAKEELASLAMDTAQKIIADASSAELDNEIYNKFLSESSDE